MGRLKTWETTQPWQKELGTELSEILGEAAPELLSRVFEEEDYGDILSDFKKYVSSPALRMWQDVVAPEIREGFNLPGAFYTHDRARGMRMAGEEFLTTRVNPLLFSSLEGWRGRNLSRQSIYANLLTGTQSLAVSPTVQGAIAEKQKSGLGSTIGGVAGLIAGVAFPGMFEVGGMFEGANALDLAAAGSIFGGGW